MALRMTGLNDALNDLAVWLELAGRAAPFLDELVTLRAQGLRAAHKAAVNRVVLGFALGTTQAVDEDRKLVGGASSANGCAAVEDGLADGAALTVGHKGDVVQRASDGRARHPPVQPVAPPLLKPFMSMTATQFLRDCHCAKEQDQKERSGERERHCLFASKCVWSQCLLGEE